MESISSNKLNIILGGYNRTRRCNEDLCTLVKDMYNDLQAHAKNNLSYGERSFLIFNYELRVKSWGNSCALHVTPNLFAAFISLMQNKPGFEDYEEFLSTNCQ